MESLKGPAGSDGAVAPAAPTAPKGETGDSAFTVTSSGQLSLGNNKVGIGIDSAEATLHIKDSRPTLRLTDGASPGVADYEIANDDDILFIRSIPSDNILTLTPNGYVGIGTDSPTSPLTVSGNSEFIDPDGKGAKVIIGHPTIGGDTTSGNIRIYDSKDNLQVELIGGSKYTFMNGNVGIGTENSLESYTWLVILQLKQDNLIFIQTKIQVCKSNLLTVEKC